MCTLATSRALAPAGVLMECADDSPPFIAHVLADDLDPHRTRGARRICEQAICRTIALAEAVSGSLVADHPFARRLCAQPLVFKIEPVKA